jgi:hypothetical protein
MKFYVLRLVDWLPNSVSMYLHTNAWLHQHLIKLPSR